MNDEQRVVDGQAQSNEFDEVGDVEHHQEVMGQGVDDAERARHRAAGDQQGHQRCPREPEHQSQDQEGHEDGQ